MIIRSAKDKNASEIKQLIFNIWCDEYQFNVKEEDYPDLQYIEKYYDGTNGLFFVAIEKDKVIATIACSKLATDCFVLKRMFVDANYRGQGIAQQLLDYLFEKIVSDVTCTFSIYLSTKESDAIAAKKLYLKNGFDVIDKSCLPANFPFFYEDDLFMIKKMVKEKHEQR